MPFIERDGVSVHYELEGDGPPLFLLIGAGGDGRAWRKAGYTAQLAGDHCCIAVDPRGFGRSSRPAEAEALRLEEFAADVLAIADEFELERFVLWGHSAGGYVGYTVAAAEPSRVIAIVGAGAAPNLDEAEASGWREWADATAAAARVATDVLEVADEIVAPEGIDLPPWLRDMFRSSDREMFARLLQALSERFRPEWLHLAPPRLLLLGEQEVPPDSVPKARLALPNTEIVLLLGVGHVGGFLARVEAIRAARPFLAHVTAQVRAAGHGP
jgi:pimeloyl-ACP methyl ester carboxylesterase